MIPGGLLADGPPPRTEPLGAALARLAHAGILAHAFFLPISLAGVQIGLLFSLGALVLARVIGMPAWRRSALDLPILLAVAAALLTIAITWALGHPPRSLETVTRWKPVLAPIVILSALSLRLPGDGPDAPRRRAVLALVVWSAGAAIASGVGIVQATLGVDLAHVIGRRDAPLLAEVPRWPGHHAAVGFYPWYPQFAHNLVPPLALAAALALSAPLRRGTRAILGAAAAVAAIAVALTVSRAAWGSLVAVVGVLLFLAGGRLRRIGLPAALAAIVALSALHPGLRARLGNVLAPDEDRPRQVKLEVCTALVREHPLGIGLGNFRALADAHFDRIAPEYPVRTGCHLTPLGLLVEGGPLLLAAWIAAAVLVLLAFARWRAEGDPLARAAAAGALAAFVGLGVNGLFHDVHRESHATWAIGLALGLAAVLAAPRARRTASGEPPAGERTRGRARVPARAPVREPTPPAVV